jgi:hypothetical protein
VTFVSEYVIADRDSAPVVVGGVGGSGTRLVARILREQGVSLSGELNEALNNLWFSLLFVRRTILLMPPAKVRQLAWLFTNSMRDGLRVPVELVPLLDEAARHDRGPALTRAVLQRSRQSILNRENAPDSANRWGWKQPNSHVMVPLLNQCFSRMKYIYVVRNGLDMAFSGNQNQLTYFWGDLLLDGDTSPTPRNALRYWVACYKRIMGDCELLGDRLYILNFDELCNSPAEQIQKLNQFLELDVSRDKLHSLAGSITVPDSCGRYRQRDCGQFDALDIEFLKTLGFPAEL